MYQQGGSENDDATSVGSSSYGLSVLSQSSRVQKMLKTYGSSRSFRRRAKSRIVQPCIVSSNAEATPLPPPSSAGRKVSPQNSESSSTTFGMSDQGCSKSKSGSSTSLKSMQTLVRTRSVRVIMNKTSFKPRRTSLNCSPISEDLNVGRATCSSILKGKKFPQNVHLHSEVDPIATMKVCSYHHCSLHGHHHDPAPPSKRTSYKNSRSLKSQKIMKPKSEAMSGGGSSGSRKKDFPTSQMIPKLGDSSQELDISSTVLTPLKDDKGMKLRVHGSRKANGESTEPKSVEIPLAESSYQGMYSLVKSEWSCKTEQQKSTEVDSYVLEASASRTGCDDQEGFANDDVNADHSLAAMPNLNDQVRASSENDPNLICESWKGEPLILMVKSDDFDKSTEAKTMSSSTSDNNYSDDLKASQEEKNHSSDPGGVFVSGSTQVGGSDTSKLTLDENFELSGSSRERKQAQVNKDKHISMWHLVQKHISSSLAPVSETKPSHGEDNGPKVDDPNTLPVPAVSENTLSYFDPNISKENNVAINQDIELRKVFAIKLVQEAIEKILLPEIPDQSSDDQSVTSDAASELDFSEKDHGEEFAENRKKEFDERKEKDNESADLDEAGRNVNNTLGPEKEKAGRMLQTESEKKAPKHWSNLKKWILLQRFIKALEKVRKFNPSKPQHLQLEPDPEAEKVSLRHQTTEDRKKVEEWMLDYALQQAISQLAPTQKKKVALLVKAFETVVPPQEDSDIHPTLSKIKETTIESHSRKVVDESVSSQEADKILASGPNVGKELVAGNTDINPSLPKVSASEALDSVCSKPYGIMSCSAEELTENGRTSSCTAQGSEITSSVSENLSLRQSITSPEETKGESKTAHGNLEIHEDLTSCHDSELSDGQVSTKNIEIDAVDGKSGGISFASELLKRVDNEKFSTTHAADCSASKSDTNNNEEEKKNHIKMWHMVYQHVVSNIAEKVGPKLLLDGEDDEGEDANKLPEFSTINQDEGDEKYATSPRSGFSRTEAIKLVQEAVDEILLPEIQDDISETEQGLPGKNHIEGGGEKDSLVSSHSWELNKNGLHNSKVVTLLDQEERVSAVDIMASREDERPESIVQSKCGQPKPKNWSKLRKMILLKRCIKALEKARTIKPQTQKNPDPEKVGLRHQMMDERKKAEQWMLDYAVQNIVHKLTPARKRRVAMLVEAFEAVVPLPEI